MCILTILSKTIKGINHKMTRSMIKLNNYFKSIKTIKILIKTIKNLPNKYKQNKKKR